MPFSRHDHSAADEKNPAAGIRLQRFLAATGLGSRRKCETYIVDGRVSVDGHVARDLGTRVDPGKQEVRVDGEIVRRDPPRYFLLNKPRGYLCTTSDPAGRPRALDLLPPSKLRLFTVGRLDEGSEGLILLTNDGEMAHKLAHPRFQVPRTYAIQVAGRPTPATFATLKEGLYFQEGRFHVRWVKRVSTKGNSTFLQVGLSHGQNREIRRLFARVGHKVMRLRRVAFGPLLLGHLGEGRHRTLTHAELVALRELATTRKPRPRYRPDDKPRQADQQCEPAGRERPREESAAGQSRTRKPRVGRRGEQRRVQEEFAGERQRSLQGGGPRTRQRAGASQKTASQKTGGRRERTAAVRTHGEGEQSARNHGSRGPRKRRQRHA